MQRTEALSLQKYASKNGIRTTLCKPRDRNPVSWIVALDDTGFYHVSHRIVLERINLTINPHR